MTRVTSTTAGSPSYAAASRRLASSAPATVHAAGSTCQRTCHRPTDERTTAPGIGTRPERTSRISRPMRWSPSVSKSTCRRRTSDTLRLEPRTVGLTPQNTSLPASFAARSSRWPEGWHQ